MATQTPSSYEIFRFSQLYCIREDCIQLQIIQTWLQMLIMQTLLYFSHTTKYPGVRSYRHWVSGLVMSGLSSLWFSLLFSYCFKMSPAIISTIKTERNDKVGGQNWVTQPLFVKEKAGQGSSWLCRYFSQGQKWRRGMGIVLHCHKYLPWSSWYLVIKSFVVSCKYENTCTNKV